MKIVVNIQVAIQAAAIFLLMISFSGFATELETKELAENAENAEKKAETRVRRTGTMRPVIYNKLDEIRQLSDDKNYKLAREKLSVIKEMQKNDYEQAMTWNMDAYVNFNGGNYANALSAYNEVLKIDNLPQSLEVSSQYSLAKLNMQQEQFEPALSALNAWFHLVDKPNADAYMLRAQINYQLQQYDAAIPDVIKALAVNKEQGKIAPENWLLMERALYYQNKDFSAMERSLKELIVLYPKAQYWSQLAAVYNELNQPEKELATLELAYEQKMLNDETQLVSLSQALLAKEVPFKSAQILLQGMKDGVITASNKNLSLLGDALMIAKEYDQAIIIIERLAKQSQLAKDFFKLAQIRTDRQQWQLALADVDLAITLGGLKNVHTAYILKGMMLFNLNRLADAKSVFQQAQQFPEAKNVVEQWLKYIDGEEQRRAYLATQ